MINRVFKKIIDIVGMYWIYIKLHVKKKTVIKLPFRGSIDKLLWSDKVNIGNNVFIGKYAHLVIGGGKFSIGDRTRINDGFELICNNSVEIGENVVIGPMVFIGDSEHTYDDISKPIIEQPMSEDGYVKIEDDCWVGAGVCISQNVIIGKHSVIGANAVVTKEIPPYSVAVGVPARVIKKYDFNKQQWLKVGGSEK